MRGPTGHNGTIDMQTGLELYVPDNYNLAKMHQVTLCSIFKLTADDVYYCTHTGVKRIPKVCLLSIID